jgi:hypothetical protein
MQSLEINYVYRQSKEKDLEAFLSGLQNEVGGEREPYGSRKGALDLVSFLELAVVFTAGIALRPVVQKYFEGLLNADALKKLGEEHRKQLVEWFVECENSLLELIQAVQSSLALIHTSFTFRGKEEALVLEVPTGAGTLYVVLNHKNISPVLLKNLPKGIVSAIRFLYETGFPDRTIAFQLYYDREAKEWIYLFAPSMEGFGNYIDRYVDLRDGQVKFISSPQDFSRLFQPSVEDEFKFLVSPFRQDGT